MCKPRVDLIELFWSKFTHTFNCKLDHFINIANICALLRKDPAYNTEKVNLWKKICEIDPKMLHYKDLGRRPSL